MKFGFVVKGFKFDVGVTILEKKALLSILFQLVEPPAICKASVTAFTVCAEIGVSKV